MTNKLDLELGQVDEDNDGEMDGGRIVIYQAVRHRFGTWSVWSLEKSFYVGKLVQRAHVLVGYCELFC